MYILYNKVETNCRIFYFVFLTLSINILYIKKKLQAYKENELTKYVNLIPLHVKHTNLLNYNSKHWFENLYIKATCIHVTCFDILNCQETYNLRDMYLYVFLIVHFY